MKISPPLTQPYYTVKFTKIQAILAKMGIFVIYDNFYVNIIMLTQIACCVYLCTSDYSAQYVVVLSVMQAQDIEDASFLSSL